MKRIMRPCHPHTSSKNSLSLLVGLMTLRNPFFKNNFAAIISCYAPTFTSIKEIKDAFYADLDIT